MNIETNKGNEIRFISILFFKQSKFIVNAKVWNVTKQKENNKGEKKRNK